MHHAHETPIASLLDKRQRTKNWGVLDRYHPPFPYATPRVPFLDSYPPRPIYFLAYSRVPFPCRYLFPASVFRSDVRRL